MTAPKSDDIPLWLCCCTHPHTTTTTATTHRPPPTTSLLWARGVSHLQSCTALHCRTLGEPGHEPEKMKKHLALYGGWKNILEKKEKYITVKVTLASRATRVRLLDLSTTTFIIWACLVLSFSLFTV